MPRRCVPCLSPQVKSAILGGVRDDGLEDLLRNIPDCRPGTLLDLCMSEVRGKRARSAWQEFVSECLKRKGIKGFGQAAEKMKECAAEWRARKR